MCSELTPCAPIPDGRMERIMQPCLYVLHKSSHPCGNKRRVWLDHFGNPTRNTSNVLPGSRLPFPQGGPARRRRPPSSALNNIFICIEYEYGLNNCYKYQNINMNIGGPAHCRRPPSSALNINIRCTNKIVRFEYLHIFSRCTNKYKKTNQCEYVKLNV